MHSTALFVCLFLATASGMTIWKPNMPDNKYKLKIASKTKEYNGVSGSLNNALSMDIMNEIPGLAKTSSTSSKDGTYTRTVVQKTYTSTHSIDDFGKSLKGSGKLGNRIAMNTAKSTDNLTFRTLPGGMTGKLTSRTVESAPQALVSDRQITVRSLPSRSLTTRRVVTSKTSPEITSRTITTRTSSVKIPPKITSTSRRVVTSTNTAETIPLFSSLSKFATKTTSMQSRPVVTSSGTNPVRSSISESFSSQSSSSSSSRRNMATKRLNSDPQPFRTASTTRRFTPFLETSTPAKQLPELSSSKNTGIEIPTSKRISMSEFSSRFSSAKELLPRSGASDFTVIRVRERAPAPTYVEQSSSGSSMRKTTKKFNSFEKNSGSLSSSPTFVTSSMSSSARSSKSLNEATIASPELMPVTAGGSVQASASNNMVENMVAASIATEGDTNLVEGAAEVAGNVVEGAQEMAGNVVENVQEGAENVVEAVGNVGENIAEVGANAVENVAEGMEKGAEMIAEGAENVVEGVKEVIDDGLPNPLLSGRGDTDNTLDIGEVDDKELEMETSLRDRDSKSREIGASGRLRISGDSGEDSNGDGNSDSEEIDSNSGEDSNGDGDSDSEERGGRSYYSRRRSSDSGEDSNGDGDSDSEERSGRRRGSRRGRWWRRGGRGSDSSADSGSSSRGSDSSDESSDSDGDDSGSDSSSSDSMEDDFDYFEDMNDFWMNGGSRSSSRRSENGNLNLQTSSQSSSSPGYQRGDMRRIISQIRNNGGAVISLPEARSNTMVHFFVKWRKSNISRKGQKMFIRTPEATVAILRHPNRRN